MQCSFTGCNRSQNHSDGGRAGFCSLHYQRFKKHGDASVVGLVPSPAKDWITANAGHSGEACLPWPFCVGKDGYGRAHNFFKSGALSTASRLMCICAHGNPPTETHEAAHSCGNGAKACVNPRHLYWATPTRNQRDRVGHGTSNRGERQWRSKLKADDVLEIRRLLSQTTQAAIAQRYGVDPSVISDIHRRKKWGWLE